MSFTKQASDWKVATVAQVGGAASVGGGVFWVMFQSDTAGVKETFAFSGGGIGVGGSAGGASLTPDSPSAIVCDRAFSVADLHNSAGRLTLAGASLAVGYALVYISAFNWSGSMFSSQYAGGFGAGVGLGAMSLVGVWTSMTIAAT